MATGKNITSGDIHQTKLVVVAAVLMRSVFRNAKSMRAGGWAGGQVGNRAQAGGRAGRRADGRADVVQQRRWYT